MGGGEGEWGGSREGAGWGRREVGLEGSGEGDGSELEVKREWGRDGVGRDLGGDKYREEEKE